MMTKQCQLYRMAVSIDDILEFTLSLALRAMNEPRRGSLLNPNARHITL